MKKQPLFILSLILFFPIISFSQEFPQLYEDSWTKLVMPGGIFFFMEKDEAIARLQKRHPVQIFEGGAYYQVTQNGIRETYQIKFACNRVWAIQFEIMGPDDAFYERLAPLKDTMEKLRPYYFGPVYGEYNIKAALVEDENIKLNIFDTRIDGKASINIDHFLGDLFEEPVLNCPDNQ